MELENENAPVGEPAGEEAVVEEKKVALPLKSAIRKAIENNKDREREINPVTTPSAAELSEPAGIPAGKPAVEEDVAAPAEFNLQEVDAWKRGDKKAIRAAWDRVNNDRLPKLQQAIERANKLEGESRTFRELAARYEPYIKSQGEKGIPPEQALLNALNLVYGIQKDKKAAAVELRKIGLNIVDEPDAETGNRADPALQKELDGIKAYIRDQEVGRHRVNFEASYNTLLSEKTRTGDPVYPDLLDTSEWGQQFGRKLGSLTVNPDFIQGVLRRFPDADHAIVVREAYKFAGGRVLDQPVKASSKSNPEHLDRSRRAAASSPGRGTEIRPMDGLKNKLPRRSAVLQAIQNHRSRHG